MVWLLWWAVSVLCDSAEAQNAKQVVVHAGHVLDVKTGRLLADQTLVIEDGKIVSMGASGESESSRRRHAHRICRMRPYSRA